MAILSVFTQIELRLEEKGSKTRNSCTSCLSSSTIPPMLIVGKHNPRHQNVFCRVRGKNSEKMALPRKKVKLKLSLLIKNIFSIAHRIENPLQRTSEHIHIYIHIWHLFL